MTAAAPTSPSASVTVEQELLGAILITSGNALESVEPFVTAADFSQPVHQLLFEKFGEARKAGRGITLSLALAALGNDSTAELMPNVTVGQYVARIAAAATTISGAADYAKVVREFANRRRIRAATDAIATGIEAGAAPAELATFGIDQLDAIASTQPGRRSRSSSMGEAAALAIEKMQWGMQHPGELSGISWGIGDLDRRTNGLQRGDLVILGGRPGMGKSGLIGSATRQSATLGNTILLFSLEMSAESLANRSIADAIYDPHAPLPYHSIARGDVNNHEAQRVIDAARDFKRLPIRIEDQAGISVAQIATRARRHAMTLQAQGRRLDMIVVDHLHLVKATDRYKGNRVSEITEISGSLKALAKELDVPVVALAQLSRKVEERDDKRPMLSDLRDSGALEQDADLIIFLYREAYYLERMKFEDQDNEGKRIARLYEVQNEVEAIIAKQRNGATSIVTLFFDAAHNAVRNLARAA